MSAFHRPARPRTVTIALWWVFLLGAWNAARAVTLGRQSDLLLDLGVVLSPHLRLALAMFWAVVFCTLTVMLKQKRPITRRAIPLLLTVYALTELALLFFFVQSSVARRTWLLNTMFYLAMITFTYWALNRAAADNYFE